MKEETFGVLKFAVSYFFFKEIKTFIQQESIKLIQSDSKYFSITTFYSKY